MQQPEVSDPNLDRSPRVVAKFSEQPVGYNPLEFGSIRQGWVW